MNRSILPACLCLAYSLVSAVPATAKDNVREQRAALEARHDKVIYGKHIDESEYAKFLISLSVAPEAAAVYLESLATAILVETGERVAVATLRDVLHGKQENTIVGGKPVYVGIVT